MYFTAGRGVIQVRDSVTPGAVVLRGTVWVCRVLTSGDISNVCSDWVREKQSVNQDRYKCTPLSIKLILSKLCMFWGVCICKLLKAVLTN